jgi:hypothetical protein
LVPLPSYTSGHATIGGALFKMMGDYYQRDDIHFTIISDEFNTVTVDQNGVKRPLMPRSYDSFSQASGENAISRIYLGIHYHFDAVEGIRSGNNIADYIFQNALLPLHSPQPTPIPSMDPEAQIQLAIAHEGDTAQTQAPSNPGQSGPHALSTPVGQPGGGSGSAGLSIALSAQPLSNNLPHPAGYLGQLDAMPKFVVIRPGTVIWISPPGVAHTNLQVSALTHAGNGALTQDLGGLSTVISTHL